MRAQKTVDFSPVIRPPLRRAGRSPGSPVPGQIAEARLFPHWSGSSATVLSANVNQFMSEDQTQFI